MEALKNALALLVALESRIPELVDPVEQISAAVRALVKEIAVVLGTHDDRVEQLEARVAQLEKTLSDVAQAALHPPLIVHPDGGLSLLDGAVVKEVAAEPEPAAEKAQESPAPTPAPAADKSLAGAPDPLKVFGFEQP